MKYTERVTQYERQRKKSCQVLEGKKKGDDLAKIFPERVLILLAAWSDAPSKQQPALPLSDHRKQSLHEQKPWQQCGLRHLGMNLQHLQTRRPPPEE